MVTKHQISIEGTKTIRPGRLYIKFPDKLVIALKSSFIKDPVPNRAVFLSFRSARNFDYEVGPRLTDRTGSVTFTIEEVRNEINWALDHLTKDYFETYEECFNDFTVTLLTKSALANFFEQFQSNEEFVKTHAKAFELIQRAQNSNSAIQEWNFEAGQLTIRDGVAHTECFVD